MNKPISILSLLFCLFLAACGEEKVGVSYGGVNHTDKSIVSVIVNGEGGILDVVAHGGGGAEMCCVMIPRQWKPGLMVMIKWQEDGDWLLDADGKEVIRNGKQVYVPAPWKERTIEIPKYDRVGDFYIHFLPGDEVKGFVSAVMPHHPDYPFRYPR